MAIVYGIEDHGGLKATVVDAFGVYSAPALSTLLLASAQAGHISRGDAMQAIQGTSSTWVVLYASRPRWSTRSASVRIPCSAS